MFTLLSIVAASVLIYVIIWFLYSQKIGRLDIADEAWGLAQPFIVIVAMLISRNFSIEAIIILLLTLVWGYRLFSHIRKRHTKSPEDNRYVEMKKNWKTLPRVQAFIYVFLLQGTLMFLLSSASLILVFTNSGWNPLSLFGLIVWIAGFAFEAIADSQLRTFTTNPENKGRIMDRGLWRYSRHPNYFGEVTMWWGVFFFVYIITGALWAVVTPLIITYLIVFVSGIPLVEKHFEGKPGWQEYKEKTSALIPWPNRR